MRGFHPPFPNLFTDKIVEKLFGIEIDLRRRTGLQTVNNSEILARTDFIRITAEKNERFVRILAKLTGDMGLILDQTDNRNDWCWIDRLLPAFVVETHISTDNRNIKKGTSFRQPADRLLQAVKNLRFVRIPKIQIIGHRQRNGTTASEIAERFRHRDQTAPIGIEIAIAAIAVIGNRNKFFNTIIQPQTDDASIASRFNDRVALPHRVELTVNPPFGRDRRIFEHPRKHLRKRSSIEIVNRRRFPGPVFFQMRRLLRISLIERTFFGECTGRNLSNNGSYLADDNLITFPYYTVKNREHRKSTRLTSS